MASDLDFILRLLLFLLPKIGYSYPEALITARNYINLPVKRPTLKYESLSFSSVSLHLFTLTSLGTG